MVAALALLTLAPSAGAVTTTRDAAVLAGAIARDPAIVTGASLEVVPPSGYPTGVGPSYGPNALPRHGADFAVLSNGGVGLPGEPNSPSNRNGINLGGSARSAFDVTVLRLNLAVPQAVNCLAVSFDYFTQDFVFGPGTYSDAFLAELDLAAPWSAPPGNTTTAPESFTTFGSANAVSVDSAGPGATGYNGAAVAANAQDTGYAGALGWAVALTPVSPGAHSVDFSLFDRGDQPTTPAVLLDDLRVLRRTPGACARGIFASQDMDAPAVSLTSPADGATTSASPSFGGVAGTASGDDANVQLRIFAGGAQLQSLSAPVSSGSWGVTAGFLPPGTYTAQAEQVDAAGNIGQSATRSFTVPPFPTPPPPGPTAGADALTGTARADTLCGLGGPDLIDGGAGDDTLFGDACPGGAKVSEGNDRIRGGAGNDKLFGQGGNDSLDGGAGNDSLDGGTGRDKLVGGTGNDKLNGGKGRNSYSGGGGNDRISAVNGTVETINCGAGRKDSASVDRKDKVKGCEKVRRRRK